MELSSRLVGSRLKEYRGEVSWRETTNYAAAVEDANPAYLDDTREGGLVAPPMFAVAATWPVLGRLWEYIEVEEFPAEVLTTLVHCSERIDLHRLVKPGDNLVIGGSIAAILPHRSGTHVVLRLEARDPEGGRVFTEHIGAMLRGVKCLDGDRGQEELPPPPEVPTADAALWEAVVGIDRLRPYLYDGCTDIVFPIHTSQAFARHVGLPGIILQGTATLAYAAREIVNREADGDPSRLATLGSRFTGMVLPGSEIRVVLRGRQEGADGTELHFEVRGPGERNPINGGYAVVRRP